MQSNFWTGSKDLDRRKTCKRTWHRSLLSMIECDILIVLKCFEPFFYKIGGNDKTSKRLQVWEKTVFIFVVHITFLLILNIVP